MLNLPYKILETQTLAAPAASVTFAGIAALVAAWDALAKVTSRHLAVIVNAASPDAVAQRDVYLQFNADAGANYHYQTLEGEGAVASAARLDAQNQIALFPIPGTTYANAFGGGKVVIPHAFGAVNHKAVLTLGGAAEDEVEAVAGRWASIAAITSIVLAPSAGNFATGSEFHLAVVDERYLIEEILLAADGLPVFRNIPQREGDLAMVAYMRDDKVAIFDTLYHDINGDAVNANYHYQNLKGQDAVAPSASTGNFRYIGLCTADNATPNAFEPMVVNYSQYAKGENQPHYLSLVGHHDAVTPEGKVFLWSGRRANIEPITSLTYYSIAGNIFRAGSLFSLYHVPKRLIKRVELQVDTPTVTFDAIPQDFEALVLNVYARTDTAALTDELCHSFNDDAVAANYDRQYLSGAGAAVAAGRSAAYNRWFVVDGATEGAGQFSGGQMYLPAYTKTDRHKHAIILNGENEDVLYLLSARWENTAAIVKIVLTPVVGTNFKHGSVFELWGILPTEGLPTDSGMPIGV